MARRPTITLRLASIWPLLTALLASPFVAADDEGPLEDGGYLEIGATAFARSPIQARLDGEGRRSSFNGATLYLAGSWRKGPAFVEGRSGGQDGASLGITLWNDDRRVLDLLAVHVQSIFTLQFYRGLNGVEAEADDEIGSADLLDRDRAFRTSGLRYREYRGNTLLQASALVDWKNGNGLLLGLHAGHQWQLGNWNLEGILGVRWAGADLVDFLHGVDEDEATERFAAYRGEDTLFGEASLGITRGLGRNWVLRSNVRARHFGDGITDSPLIAAGDEVSADLGVAYVF